MSTFQARSGSGSGTVNFGLADLPDGSKAIEHVVLGADGNPIVPVLDASMQALTAAVVSSVAAAQAFVTGNATTLVNTFGTTIASAISVSNSGNTDAFGNPI